MHVYPDVKYLFTPIADANGAVYICCAKSNAYYKTSLCLENSYLLFVPCLPW